MVVQVFSVKGFRVYSRKLLKNCRQTVRVKLKVMLVSMGMGITMLFWG
jgi:hypothetical protein